MPKAPGNKPVTNRRFQAAFLTVFLLIAVAVLGFGTINGWNRASHPDPSTRAATQPGDSSLEQPDSHAPSNEIDPSIVDYVGSRACRDCHSEIWQKYQSHPMSHSFSKINDVLTIEDYAERTEYAPTGNRRYRVERRGDEVFHHESMLDQQGDVIYDQSVAVIYAIGSGKRGRGYIIDRDGLLFQSSISWYSDIHEWRLSPDYPTENHPRFERRVTSNCLTCHTGMANFIRGEADRFNEPRFLEESIGCERCHGPGRKHVTARQSGDIANDSIVNPKHLDVDRREAVCAQCHLKGELRVLRTGRTPHDFRPGEQLDDNWITFVESRADGVSRPGRTASQIEHMVGSRCFQKSDGRMGCVSCHDPHSVPSDSEKVDFYRQRCLKCHADQGCSLPLSDRQASGLQDNCASCHMSSINSPNALHRTIADHRILRRPSNDDSGERGEAELFQFTPRSIPQSELNRSRAFKSIHDAPGPPAHPEFAEAAKQLLLPLIAESPNDPELQAAMGNVLQLQNQPREATRWWLRALELNPRHEKTVQSLATVFHDEFQAAPAEFYLKRYIELNPWHAAYHGRLATTLMVRGDAKGAIASAERALELNPTIWRLDEFLKNAYKKTGDRESSDKHRTLLIRKHPPDRESAN